MHTVDNRRRTPSLPSFSATPAAEACGTRPRLNRSQRTSLPNLLASALSSARARSSPQHFTAKNPPITDPDATPTLPAHEHQGQRRPRPHLRPPPWTFQALSAHWHSGPPSIPTSLARNRLSPFSTENVVYAAVSFHCSARFPHLWIYLWINTSFPLQITILLRMKTPAARGHYWTKRCTLRGSSAVCPVEKPGRPGYNDRGLSACPIYLSNARPTPEQ